jgi:predicted GIY-YIG superfamily endonuclease
VPQRLRLGRPVFFTDDHGKGLSNLTEDFYYVYILVTEADGETHYTSITRDLAAGLSKHNQGAYVQTSKNRPWKIAIAIAFRSEAKAQRIEHYLKTGSGREFARRHF